jgi:hypothetical protein
VDLMNTTGCTVWQTGPETRYTCIRTQGQSVVDYLMGPASFLKFTTSSRTTSWTMIVITC